MVWSLEFGWNGKMELARSSVQHPYDTRHDDNHGSWPRVCACMSGGSVDRCGAIVWSFGNAPSNSCNNHDNNNYPEYHKYPKYQQTPTSLQRRVGIWDPQFPLPPPRRTSLPGQLPHKMYCSFDSCCCWRCYCGYYC